jgi:hypothetical protein
MHAPFEEHHVRTRQILWEYRSKAQKNILPQSSNYGAEYALRKSILHL